MFAGVILLAAFGIAGARLVRCLHKKIVFWEAAGGADTHARI